MKVLTNWIDSIVHPEGYQVWAVILSLGIVVGLSHWHEAWLDARLHGWLENQGDFIKLGVYGGSCLVVFLVISLVISAVVEQIREHSSPE